MLTNNANIHFETLVTELKPRIILADGSNAKYVIDLWKDRAKQLNQKFLDTYSHGAIKLMNPSLKGTFKGLLIVRPSLLRGDILILV